MDRRYIESVALKQRPEAGSYLHKLPLVNNLEKYGALLFDRDVTFFVGENGTGKSTLLEAVAVACGFNAEGGTKNFSFASKETHSDLNEYLTIARLWMPRDGFFLRAESFYNVASEIDRLNDIKYLLNSYGGRSLHQQSHGESFLALVQNRFGGNGLYILDEPESALSPSRQMALLVEIDNLVKKNSQLIIATHSPILLAYSNAAIYELTETEIKRVSYKETEHYKLTKQFLDEPERMLKYLLES